MAKKSSDAKSEVLEAAKSNGVRFIRLMFSDINGIPKNVELPVERLEEVLDSGVQFDASEGPIGGVTATYVTWTELAAL